MLRGCAILLALAAVAVPQTAGFVGPEACAPCHRDQYAKQSVSHHAGALHRIADSQVVKTLRDFREGSLGVAYRTANDGVHVSIEASDVQGTLEWAFGAGVQGITPVGVYQGRFFEHRFSYYSARNSMAVTFGHPRNVSGPESELGVMQDGKTISRCFNCHATGVRMSNAGPDLSAMRAGVTCERCHGPAAAHVQAAKNGATGEVIRRAVVNPRNFPARAQVQMCGDCHRLPSPDNMVPEPEIVDPVSVRMSPIGLMASKCFRSGKLSCMTCHDPHSDARPRSDAMYSQRCLSCHPTAAAAKSKCTRPAGDCVSCHMPQASLGPYLKFTDHRIRTEMSKAR